MVCHTRVPLGFDLITLMLFGQRSKLKLLKRLPLRTILEQSDMSTCYTSNWD